MVGCVVVSVSCCGNVVLLNCFLVLLSCCDDVLVCCSGEFVFFNLLLW